MKIFEFNPGIGTFSLGFETLGDYEVVQTLKITNNELYTYNKLHKHSFKASIEPNIRGTKLKKHDFGILRPDFGVTMANKRPKSINMDDLWACLSYIHLQRPKIALIITPPPVIKLLNTHPSYVKDGFGMASKDIVLASMLKSGYNCWQFVVDQVQCGVPMYYPVNFYLGVREDVVDGDEMHLPEVQYGISVGKLPYTTVLDALGDLPVNTYEHYSDYPSEPVNSYQGWARHHACDKIRNNQPHRPPHDALPYLYQLKPGCALRNLEGCMIAKGKRARLDRPATISADFYKMTGSGYTIHPISHRPFTIREGMRLHGLPDHAVLKKGLSTSTQAHMVHEGISPLTAYYIMGMIQSYLTQSWV